MATVVADFSVGIESTENVVAGLLTSTFSGDFSGDFGPAFGGGAPFELGFGVLADGIVPAELLSAQHGGSARMESTALFTWDAALALEAGLAARADSSAAAESLLR